MSILKVRNLGAVGVIADIDPYELPLGAWSFAVNARFNNGKIERGPVWRKADILDYANPRFVFVDRSTSTDALFVCYNFGRVYKWVNGVETDYSKSGYAQTDAEATWTTCSLGNVTYINRADRVPWALTPGTSAFVGVTDWNAAHTAQIFRAYNSALVALNVTKSGTNYPSLVKTSDIVKDPGVQPANWDITSPTSNATENTLTELQGAIKDACVLGDDLVIYGTTQNFVMRADGGDNVYSYRRLPFDGGAIAANCAVEVEGRHYVFGPNDIYMHDGLSKVSVIDGKNREFVYSSLNASKASKFFVSYNPNRKEISFNYVGSDSRTAFSGGVGCNRSAVLHVPSGRWTFDDLPFVHACVVASITVDAPTWANVTTTWETVGGSWQDLEDGFKKAPIYVGESSGTYSFNAALYVHDPYGRGSVVAAPVEAVANPAMYLERDGIDLDEVNVELRGYKHVISIFPQGRSDQGAASFQFSFGVADYFGQTPTWSSYMTYDPTIDYKLDFDNGGRYLAVRILYSDYKTAVLTGLDLDVEVLSDGP